MCVSYADRDLSAARYEQSIQIAFREVSDALAEAAADTYRMSEARYRQGIDNHLSLPDAQRDL